MSPTAARLLQACAKGAVVGAGAAWMCAGLMFFFDAAMSGSLTSVEEVSRTQWRVDIWLAELGTVPGMVLGALLGAIARCVPERRRLATLLVTAVAGSPVITAIVAVLAFLWMVASEGLPLVEVIVGVPSIIALSLVMGVLYAPMAAVSLVLAAALIALWVPSAEG